MRGILSGAFEVIEILGEIDAMCHQPASKTLKIKWVTCCVSTRSNLQGHESLVAAAQTTVSPKMYNFNYEYLLLCCLTESFMTLCSLLKATVEGWWRVVINISSFFYCSNTGEHPQKSDFA
jgi:hypothetical protein